MELLFCAPVPFYALQCMDNLLIFEVDVGLLRMNFHSFFHHANHLWLQRNHDSKKNCSWKNSLCKKLCNWANYILLADNATWTKNIFVLGTNFLLFIKILQCKDLETLTVNFFTIYHIKIHKHLHLFWIIKKMIYTDFSFKQLFFL